MAIAIVLMFVGLGSTVCAHNPDNSWTVVRVVDGALRVEVGMSAETAMALMGIPIGTQGIPPNRDDLLPPLTKVARGILRFAVGSAALELREAKVEFREEDGIAFLLEFALPIDLPNPALLEFDASYLGQLPPMHRAAITLVDAHGGVIAGRVLTPEKRAGDLPLG